MPRPGRADETAAGRQRNRAHLGRPPRLDIDDDHPLLLAGLAEVELEERAGVLGGNPRARHPLRRVDVAEGDVLRAGRNRLRRGRVCLAHVELTLAARGAVAVDLGTTHQEVGNEECDRIVTGELRRRGGCRPLR